MVTSSSPKKNIALWAPQPLPTQNATNKNMFKQKVLHHSAFLHPFLDDRLPTRTETPFRSPVKLVVWWMQFLERIRRLKIYQEIPWRKSPFRETQRHFPAKRKSVENSHGWKRWQLSVWLISSRSWTRMTSSKKMIKKDGDGTIVAVKLY